MVAEGHGDTNEAHRRNTMQRTIGLKRFVITHVGAAAIAIGVLLSGTLGLAGLAATGNLPWQSGNDARPAVSSQAARAAQLEQMQRFYDAKMARLEAAELQAAVLAARAARQEKLRRFYEHKEEKLDALP
jgi:hypothetical protein